MNMADVLEWGIHKTLTWIVDTNAAYDSIVRLG